MISARCVNACGKLPRWRPAAGIDLLGVEPQGAGERQELLAQLPGPVVLPDLDQRRHEPERADRERALLARQPVVGLLDAVAQHEAVDGQLVGDGEHRRPHPRVVGRQEARRAASAAATRRARRCRSAARTRRARRRRARRCRRGSRRPPPATSRPSSCSSRRRASRAPRSAATQHMSFDDVKCFGSPRTSHIPRSGSRQCARAASTWRVEDRPQSARRAGRSTSCAGTPSRAPRPTRRAGVACNAPLPVRTGRAPSYPVRWSQHPLVELALAADAVHDLELVVPLGHVGDEGEEVLRLPVEAERVQRPQRERRVADPRVAVVPVALAARRLGQRRRGRRDERAGRREREPLQREGAALEVAPPRVVGELPAGEPVLPVVRGPHQPVVRLLVGVRAARARSTTARRSGGRPPSAACGPWPGGPSKPRRMSVVRRSSSRQPGPARAPGGSRGRCTPRCPGSARSRTSARSRGRPAPRRSRTAPCAAAHGRRRSRSADPPVGRATARPRGATAP